jgi:putative glutamine amidotransferase
MGSCTHHKFVIKKDPDPLRIGFSKCSGSEKYKLYVDWIHHYDSTIVCIDLFDVPRDSALAIMKTCDGLILTGGPDVHPGYFDKAKEASQCKIEEERDTLEFDLIKLAGEKKMPILGICRGLQMLNVAFGGDLIIDIPKDHGKQVKHRCKEGNCMHAVKIDSASLLFKLVQKNQGEVNSFHHQAIGKLADDFRITAWADDSIPEAIEWKDPAGKPFMMAVQWHPERLEFNDPFAATLARIFLLKAGEYHKNHSL